MKAKKVIIKMLVLLSIITTGNKSYGQTLDWAKQIGGVGADVGLSIAVDNFKNSYVTGSFRDTVDFDPGVGIFNIYSNYGDDAFIIKLDSLGNFDWVQTISGIGNQTINSIVLGRDSNIYVVGYFENTTDFDPGVGIYNLTSSGQTDVFILKLDALGNFIWARKFGGSGTDGTANKVRLDKQENLYMTGWFEATVDFDPGMGVSILNSIGGYDIFICKFDSTGNFILVKQFAGFASYQYGTSLDVDTVGNIYITGRFNGNLDLDPGSNVYNVSSTTTSILDADIFTVKLNPVGNFVWGIKFGSTGNENANCILYDRAGSIYIQGHFSNTIDFDYSSGVQNLSSVGDIDVFVLKIDTSGNFKWVKRMGGSLADTGGEIKMDSFNNLFCLGSFKGSSDFDTGIGVFNLVTPLNYLYNTYICKLDSSGNLISAVSFSGHQNVPSGFEIDMQENIFVTGVFGYNGNYTVDFDPSTNLYNMTSNGNSDIYVVKLTQVATEAISYSINLVNFLAYPNPTKGATTITSPLTIKSLKLLTVTGSVAFSKENVNDYKITLDVKELPQGIYFVEVETERGMAVKKLVVMGE